MSPRLTTKEQTHDTRNQDHQSVTPAHGRGHDDAQARTPLVLSREELARLIDAAGKPKYQAALSVAYGAGLRASEVVTLKAADIDSTPRWSKACIG
jgi:integrase